MRSILMAVLACVMAATPVFAAPVVFSVGGDSSAASIQPTVDAFRAAVGSPNNGNAPGPIVGGRREINWDGGGENSSIVTAAYFSPSFFRGALLATPGNGFIQASPDQLANHFSNASYNITFSDFSPLRLFSPFGSNVTDVTFFVPGTGTPALVSGFGSVFTDVDLPAVTTMQFFDAGDNSLGIFNVPPGTVADGGLSFLGVIFNAGEQIARVRITTGNTALGPNDDPGSGVDVVVMDDFIYGEPFAATVVPEPASAAVVLFGACAIGSIRGSRRRIG